MAFLFKVFPFRGRFRGGSGNIKNLIQQIIFIINLKRGFGIVPSRSQLTVLT
jgi:hypothetical protein